MTAVQSGRSLNRGEVILTSYNETALLKSSVGDMFLEPC